MMTMRLAVAALALGLLYSAPASAQQTAAKEGDWPVYGGDPGAQKYSPLVQINRENVRDLEMAWTWETGEKPVPGPRQPIPGQDVYAGRFEAQPLVLNDTMYLSTSYNKIVALDAETGEVFWTFDPKAYDWGLPPNGSHFVHRGVALWSGDGERRVFINARWWLYAVDARTGEVIEDFGHEGRVDLTEALTWPSIPLHVTQTSAPVVYDDLVIVGNGVWDRFVYRGDPPGVMQAFDARTGELRWTFDLIPQPGDFGNETWEDGSWGEWGHANVWAPFSLDADRGLLYLPVGTPSSDYFGGHRKGDNLFAESVVCLDAHTGERVWHFQAVHHGLWDWDLSSPPTLMTVRHDGQDVDAVVAPSKQGFIYAFDRVTGEPLWPIEERPVPASDVPGERASETQPFPTRPAPFVRQGFSEDVLMDFTPELAAMAKEAIAGYRMSPIFTPPSLDGTLMLPGIEGGANWGGGAVDPETNVFYVKGTESPSLLKLVEADPAQSEATYQVDRSIRSISLPNGLPLIKPPYGTLSAIDMNSGDLLWQVPVGDLPNVRFHPALRGVDLPEKLGAPGPAGPMVTAGGLVFVTGGSMSLNAFDKDSGDLLWEQGLGGASSANPMTYQTRGGRQYVVVAVGAGESAKLVAFALPE
jgi:quinoprotein glucose dehydrogenase